MFRKLLFCAFSFVAVSAHADTKIVGGKVATEGVWPSTVSLIVKELAEGIDRGEYAFTDTGNVIPAEQANYWAHSCGGSLVASKWILTAAHCVVDGETGQQVSADNYLVVSGVSDLYENGLRSAIARVIVHPDYDPLDSAAPENADIALLELSESVSQSTLKLFTSHPSTNINTTVVGWGLTQDSGSRSRFLRQVDVPTISSAQCKQSVREFLAPNDPDSPYVVAAVDEAITDNMFCAGDGQGYRDSCQGDSGGPVMALVDGEYAQLGIVSWGYADCAQADTYGVYTKVGNYFNWIRSVVSPGSQTTTPSNNTPVTDDDGVGTSGNSSGGTDTGDTPAQNSETSSGSSSGGSVSIILLMVLALTGFVGRAPRLLRRR